MARSGSTRGGNSEERRFTPGHTHYEKRVLGGAELMLPVVIARQPRVQQHRSNSWLGVSYGSVDVEDASDTDLSKGAELKDNNRKQQLQRACIVFFLSFFSFQRVCTRGQVLVFKRHWRRAPGPPLRRPSPQCHPWRWVFWVSLVQPLRRRVRFLKIWLPVASLCPPTAGAKTSSWAAQTQVRRTRCFRCRTFWTRLVLSRVCAHMGRMYRPMIAQP